MQQHLITDVYLLGFLLLVGWAVARSLRKRKRNSPKDRAPLIRKTAAKKILRLAVTGLVAFAILLAFRDKTGDYAWLVWLVLWVALYWLWKLWDRWRGKGVDKAAPTLPAQIEQPPPAAPERGKPQPRGWRKILRKTAKIVGVALVVIVLMAAVMLLGLAYYQRQAKAERDKVHVGMTVEQVLPLVHGALGVRAHAILPDNVPDKELKHYVSFGSHEDTYCCFDGPDGEKRKLTAPEAAAAMHQKMADGYEWVWRYTFVNDTPVHFSFSVTFGTDGRVKQVTDVWGWD